MSAEGRKDQRDSRRERDGCRPEFPRETRRVHVPSQFCCRTPRDAAEGQYAPHPGRNQGWARSGYARSLMAGQLEAIWVKRMKRGPMDRLERATCVAGRGLAGNANQGGRRQVTIFSKETWNRLTAAFPAPPDPQVRRGNLLVSGVDLAHSRGKVLQIGPVQIRIFGETRPCEQMDAGLRRLACRARRTVGRRRLWRGAERRRDPRRRAGDARGDRGIGAPGLGLGA